MVKGKLVPIHKKQAPPPPFPHWNILATPLFPYMTPSPFLSLLPPPSYTLVQLSEPQYPLIHNYIDECEVDYGIDKSSDINWFSFMCDRTWFIYFWKVYYFFLKEDLK